MCVCVCVYVCVCVCVSAKKKVPNTSCNSQHIELPSPYLSLSLSPSLPPSHRMVGADRLRGNLSTVGIVVSDWTYYRKVRESQTNLRSITFMTWDFGGQEEYYATHQCFISRRSLYLVVWNVTHGLTGAEELRPWLLNIQVSSLSLSFDSTSEHLIRATPTLSISTYTSLHIAVNFCELVILRENFHDYMQTFVS